MESELIQNAFGGQWKPFEDDRKLVIKLIALIEEPCHLPKAQNPFDREECKDRYIGQYFQQNEVVRPNNAADSKVIFGDAQDYRANDAIIPVE